jgi:hypothetical protein
MAYIEKYNTPYFSPAPAYYGGTSFSSIVPYPFPISLGGHAYQLEWDANSIGVWGAKFKRNSLPLLRTQADASSTPGEQSVSPEQFWRRSQESWQYGKGQVYLDRATSQISRYHDSMGIDPWTPWQIKLLNDTGRKYTTTDSNVQAIVAGAYCYIMHGTTIKRSTDLASWVSVTTAGTPSAAVSMTTDGYNIWMARGTDGVYSSNTGITTTSSYATTSTNLSLVRFVKSRLIAAGEGKLYNVTTSGAIGSALLDLSSRNFTWVDVVGSPSQIYAAGYTGDKSFIYRTAIKADGTALDIPIVAGQLPDGEIVRSLGEYLGYILIGTDMGVRFCTTNADGSLVIGSIVPTYESVYCFEGQDRFVWYGLSNYDSNTGLGRMDLTTFISSLTPAYAADLMANNSGAVTGTVRTVATFNDIRIFTVDGKGLFSELANTPVASGTLVSGVIAYGISDQKVAMFLDLKHEPLHGTIKVGIINDEYDSDLTLDQVHEIGISDVQGSVSPTSAFPCGQLRGENYQLVFQLNSTGGISPIVNRWTLRSYPAPVRTAQWDVPIMLFPTIMIGDKDWAFDVQKEVNFLVGLHQNQTISTLQVAETSYQVIMYDYQWLPEAIDIEGQPRGIFYAQLREIVG